MSRESLYEGDCMDYLHSFADGSFNAIVTGAPYGPDWFANLDAFSAGCVRLAPVIGLFVPRSMARRIADEVFRPGRFEGMRVVMMTKLPGKGTFTEHPHELPVECVGRMLCVACGHGGRVLDPYFGSGSVGVACQTLGIDFVGIERDPAWCQVAKERLGL